MSQPFIGEIKMFGGTFAMRGFAFCDGQLLPIAQYDALFSLLGTTYGGDGQNTFALPDLRSRIPLGQGQGSGLTNRVIGSPAGAETVVLTTNQLPAHSHPAACSTLAGDSSTPAANFWAVNSNAATAQYSVTANTSMNPGEVSPAGSSLPHGNLAPYLAVNFVIALEGIFPSQN
jgi:microcystin-dependent protein